LVFVEVEFRGGVVSFAGEGQPGMELIEEIEVEGYRN
jgi:hypothetical protein